MAQLEALQAQSFALYEVWYATYFSKSVLEEGHPSLPPNP